MPPTEIVDNFVQNLEQGHGETASERGFDKLMTNSAAEIPMKSTIYTDKWGCPRCAEALAAPRGLLWSVRTRLRGLAGGSDHG